MTTDKAVKQKTKKLSGKHVLGAMIAFFAVIIVADAIMIYQAVSTFGGVDNANAYRDGLAYNARIAREERQAALGWKETVELKSEPPRMRVALHDASGTPISGMKVEAKLGRAATNAVDQALPLAELSPGVFEAPIASSPAPGDWIATVRVFAVDGKESDPLFETRRRLWVKP